MGVGPLNTGFTVHVFFFFQQIFSRKNELSGGLKRTGGGRGGGESDGNNLKCLPHLPSCSTLYFGRHIHAYFEFIQNTSLPQTNAVIWSSGLQNHLTGNAL